MDDPALEARAMRLYGQLRCVVCQSQSIGESNAPLAEDMRAVVRERLLLGESDAEVIGFMRERYGEYVLMMPPLQANTLLLWGLPLALLVFGGVGAIVYVRKQAGAESLALSAEEDAQLEALRREEGQE